MSRSKRIWPAPVLKNVIVLKIGPEPSVNERSIETPKTTPKLDSMVKTQISTLCGLISVISGLIIKPWIVGYPIST